MEENKSQIQKERQNKPWRQKRRFNKTDKEALKGAAFKFNKYTHEKMSKPSIRDVDDYAVYNKDDQVFQQYVQEIEELIRKRGGMRALEQQALDKISMQVFNTPFSRMSQGEKKNFLIDVLGDDFLSVAAPLLYQAGGRLANKGFNYLLDKFKRSKFYNRHKDTLEKFGSVLGNFASDHDNFMPLMQNADQVNIGQTNLKDQSNTSRSSSLSTGVNLDAIASAFAPEFAESRQPFPDKCMATGFTSKISNLSVTTNASGNAILVIRPHQLIADMSQQRCFAILYNAVSLNVEDGTQTTNSQNFPGPLYSLISSLRMTLPRVTCVKINPIVSALNSEGLITTAYTGEALQDISATSCGGLASARSYPWCMQTQILKCTHRVCIPTQIAGEQNEQTSSSGVYGEDQIMICFQGCPPSTTVANIMIYYQAEYIPNSNIAPLIDLQVPPPGPMTSQLINTIFAKFEGIVMLGPEETKKFYSMVMSSQPSFDSVISAISGFKFNVLTTGQQLVGAFDSGFTGGGRGPRVIYELVQPKKKQDFETPTDIGSDVTNQRRATSKDKVPTSKKKVVQVKSDDDEDQLVAC